MVRASVSLCEDRHHLRGATRDHATGVRSQLLVEGDAPHRDAQLAHRLLGLGVLAPRRLDEAAGLGLVAGEERPELLERRDVLPGALPQALARFLEQAEVNVAEDAYDRLG